VTVVQLATLQPSISEHTAASRSLSKSFRCLATTLKLYLAKLKPAEKTLGIGQASMEPRSFERGNA
jgi:hypothetical protein